MMGKSLGDYRKERLELLGRIRRYKTAVSVASEAVSEASKLHIRERIKAMDERLEELDLIISQMEART